MPAPKPTFTVEVEDPSGQDAAIVGALESSVLRAAAAWSEYLVGSTNIDIDVEIGSTAIGTADGGPVSVYPVGRDGGRVVELGGPSEQLLTGFDVNGGDADIKVNIDSNFIAKYLWLDPDPGNDALPSNKINADETFEHELGHALGFDGYRVGNSTSLGSYESPFDRNIAVDGGNVYFTGAAAEAVYGGAVPLTYSDGNPENFYHYANQSGPGADLVSGLMSGVGHYLGTQAYISQLDVAMLADAGCPIGLPENGTRGDDDVVAGSLPVVASLYQGDDTFEGGPGADFVFGGRGDDVLSGGAGNDFLSGGPGSNVLIGGDGADTFAVRVAGASDRILDFDPTQGDSIRLANQTYGFGTSNDGSLLLNLSGGGTVTLEGIDPSRSAEIAIVTRQL